jgi:hypothetical protein
MIYQDDPLDASRGVGLGVILGVAAMVVMYLILVRLL